MTDLSDFKELYLQTAKENITLIKSGLLTISQNQNSDEMIDQVHRNAHTLKSKSTMMGYSRIGEMAKAIEKTFYEIKERKKFLTQETRASLQKIAEAIEKELDVL